MTRPIVKTDKKRSWRAWAPWVFAGALLAYLPTRIDVGEVMGHLAAIDPLRYAGFVLSAVLLTLAADGLGTWRAYRALAPEISLRDVLVVRGASYLPTTINYHMGAAYMTYLLSRRFGISFLAILGGTLAIYASLLGDLVLIALASLAGPSNRLPWLTEVVVGLTVLGGGYAAVLVVKPRALASIPTLTQLFAIGLPGHVQLMLWRVPHVAVLHLTLWYAYGAFGVSIPFTDSLGVLPALLLVSAVPLTPQGIGTREVVALELLLPYAGTNGAAAIVAAGTAWSAVGALAQAAVGLALTRSAARVLVPTSPTETAR